MTGDSASAVASSTHKLRFGEFVALAAGLMALSAAGIDAMLPALPAIGTALSVVNPNDRQWIVTIYMIGNGAGQLLFGVLADRFGRRPVLLSGVLAYVILGGMAAFADSFELLLVLRLLHGIAASSVVVVRSIVRDCYSGHRMARVSSLTFVIFLSAPVLAPSVGQVILFVASWRWVFGFLTILGTIMLTWAVIRLPETLHPGHRRGLGLATIAEATWLSLADRVSGGYTLGLTFMMALLVGFLGSVQQIFADTFHAAPLMVGVFAFSAGTMGVASYMNSRIVGRFGVRVIAHWALLTLICSAAIHSVVALSGHETILSFALLQALTMASFALAASNFGSIAMEPMGAIAGVAASVQGVISSLGGSMLGAIIGQYFDGTTVPLAVGSTLCGIAAAICVGYAERGRLFRPELA